MPVDAPVTIAKGREAGIPGLLELPFDHLTPDFRCRSANLRNRFSPRSLSRHILWYGDFGMRALTWHGKNDIRCDTVPDPKIEHGREAIIKVTPCATCGSALPLFDGVLA